jgi:hypothetical protein
MMRSFRFFTGRSCKQLKSRDSQTAAKSTSSRSRKTLPLIPKGRLQDDRGVFTTG